MKEKYKNKTQIDQSQKIQPKPLNNHNKLFDKLNISQIEMGTRGRSKKDMGEAQQLVNRWTNFS